MGLTPGKVWVGLQPYSLTWELALLYYSLYKILPLMCLWKMDSMLCVYASYDLVYGPDPMLHVRLKSPTQSFTRLCQQNSHHRLEETYCGPWALTPGKWMKVQETSNDLGHAARYSDSCFGATAPNKATGFRIGL